MWASIVQSLTQSPDILGHLTHSSNAVCLKNVVVPPVGWSHVVLIYWVSGGRRRCNSFRSSSVFIKGDASAERADSRDVGRNEVILKIAEANAHLIVRLLALGVEVERRRWVDFDEENGALVELHGQYANNIDCITGSLGDVINTMADFERAFDAKK